METAINAIVMLLLITAMSAGAFITAGLAIFVAVWPIRVWWRWHKQRLTVR